MSLHDDEEGPNEAEELRRLLGAVVTFVDTYLAGLTRSPDDEVEHEVRELRRGARMVSALAGEALATPG